MKEKIDKMNKNVLTVQEHKSVCEGTHFNVLAGSVLEVCIDEKLEEAKVIEDFGCDYTTGMGTAQCKDCGKAVWLNYYDITD